MITVSGARGDAVPRRLAGAVADHGVVRRQQRLVAAAVVPRPRSLLLLFFFIWLRGSLPRIRYDQLMKLGWKVLIPGALGLDADRRDHPGVAPSGRQHAVLPGGRRRSS